MDTNRLRFNGGAPLNFIRLHRRHDASNTDGKISLQLQSYVVNVFAVIRRMYRRFYKLIDQFSDAFDKDHRRYIDWNCC